MTHTDVSACASKESKAGPATKKAGSDCEDDDDDVSLDDDDHRDDNEMMSNSIIVSIFL